MSVSAFQCVTMCVFVIVVVNVDEFEVEVGVVVVVAVVCYEYHVVWRITTVFISVFFSIQGLRKTNALSLSLSRFCAWVPLTQKPT